MVGRFRLQNIFLCIISSALVLGFATHPPRDNEIERPPYEPPTEFETVATFDLEMGYSLVPMHPGAVMINKHGVCRSALNQHSDRNYFVPVNSAQEWELFRASPPDQVALSGCRARFLGWSGSVTFGGLSHHFNRTNPYYLSLRSACDSCHPPFSVRSGLDSQGVDQTINVMVRAGNGGGTINIRDQDGNILFTLAVQGWQWPWPYDGSFVVPASVTEIHAEYVLAEMKSGHWNYIDFRLTIPAIP